MITVAKDEVRDKYVDKNLALRCISEESCHQWARQSFGEGSSFHIGMVCPLIINCQVVFY